MLVLTKNILISLSEQQLLYNSVRQFCESIAKALSLLACVPSDLQQFYYETLPVFLPTFHSVLGPTSIEMSC